MEIVKKFILFALLAMYITHVSADVILPVSWAIGIGIFYSWFLTIITVFIEGVIFYFCIKGISWVRAFTISFVGNVTSIFGGIIFMAVVMTFWHMAFDRILGSYSLTTYIISTVLMYTGTVVIELLSINLFFKYFFKQLLVPVVVGNFITYVLVAIRLLL